MENSSLPGPRPLNSPTIADAIGTEPLVSLVLLCNSTSRMLLWSPEQSLADSRQWTIPSTRGLPGEGTLAASHRLLEVGFTKISLLQFFA